MSDDLLRLWPRAERILDELLEAPEDERQARAVAACAGDADLERVVRSLLRADREAGGFLGDPPVVSWTEADPEPAPEVPLPAHIGPFRIVSELGRGGMGTVLLAQRDDGQFDQRVAIKILHAGAHSAFARQSFLRERAILGRLDHPHIARLYDGGVTEGGAPYFVMEYVDGRPVDEHCDALQLGIEGRLALFRQVCEAVAYAHRRLVVHRDLKPGNVLVGPDGAVKLLDFGIAKLLEESGDTTQTISRLLTPVYAAPEQLRSEPVTTATDVYQLGLLLYELLTGRRAQAGPTDSLIALQRRVMESDPPRPSRAVLEGTTDTHGAREPIGPEEISRRRGTTAFALSRRLAGDVDAVVLKALRKEPDQRYATVEAFRADLDDFLGFRPVSAGRGTAAYRLRKFAQRNRLALAAAGAVFVSLTAGLAGIGAQSRVAASERDRARVAEAKAAAINDFLVNELLRAPTPEKTLGRTLTVADVLGNASQSVGHAFAAQPDVEAEVRLTLSRTYSAMGRLAEAGTHARAAHGLLAGQRGTSGAEALRARRVLAELSIDEGRYAPARADLDELRAAQAALLGPHHPDTLETAAALGRAAHAQGESAASEVILRQALAAAETHHPTRWRLALELRRRLVDPLNTQDKALEAEAICRQMLEVQRRYLGPDHPEVAATLHRLANALYKQLRHREAAEVYEQVVALDERIYGPEHPATADALVDMAITYFNGLQRSDDAVRAVERALAIYRSALGPEHPRTLRALHDLGVAHRMAGRISVAEPIYRQVLALRRRSLGETHPDTLRSMLYLNMLLVADGRLPEARLAARDVARAYETAIAAPDADPMLHYRYAEFLTTVDPPDVRDPARALQVAERGVAATERKHFYSLRELGRAQMLNRQHREAMATLREALDLPEGVWSWNSELLLVDLLREHGSPQEMEAFLHGRLERVRSSRGDNDPLVAKTLRFLAQHHERQGRREEAERTFALVLEQLRKTRPDTNWEIGRAKGELAERLTARGAYPEAERLLREADATLSVLPNRKDETDKNRARLVRLYDAWGRPAEAARWRPAGRS